MHFAEVLFPGNWMGGRELMNPTAWEEISEEEAKAEQPWEIAAPFYACLLDIL